MEEEERLLNSEKRNTDFKESLSTMANDNHLSSNIILYSSPQGNIKVEIIYSGETFWPSQKRMAELFGCSTDNISLHLKNIFSDKELDPNSVTEEFSATAADGKTYKTKFYNLDAVIAVGYRVNSKQASEYSSLRLYLSAYKPNNETGSKDFTSIPPFDTGAP